MPRESWNDPGARARRLVRAGLARPGTQFHEPPARLILVDAETQRVTLLEHGEPVRAYAASTAAKGIGAEEGSYRTPPGWHRVAAMIGAGAAAGAVFESRVATGRVWSGDPGPDDLILTRILRLDGLEEGVNRGPGRDSFERYIYIHGTNHEDELGRPASHGCVRLANADVIELFDRVSEGDPVLIAAPPPVPDIPDPLAAGRFHYAGVAGSGMSALAQYQVLRGGQASGSDRSFDRGENANTRAVLEAMGIEILPQDGSGLERSPAALVISTAVEAQVPDVAAARARGVPVVHRSELLARFVAERRTVAVAGTSGKSTVTAMIFEILRGAGADPSVLTGGELLALAGQAGTGNAWAGRADLLVIEADESDGSLTRYAPALAVILNLHRDHRAEPEVAAMFATFAAQAREGLVLGEEENLAALAEGATTFGFGETAAVRGTAIELDPQGSRFTALGQRFTLPAPGRHNVANALAALAACASLGIDPAAMVAPLSRYHGVARRFQRMGVAGGIEVVDDFAHNPVKIAAALAAARARGTRVLAVYQPHGYGPTRFLRDGFVATFAAALRPQDRLWMLEVFYAGGTAERDFSAADIVAEIAARGATAEFAASRAALVERIGETARSGDIVLVMGARDPSLSRLAREILESLGQRAAWP